MNIRRTDIRFGEVIDSMLARINGRHLNYHASLHGFHF